MDISLENGKGFPLTDELISYGVEAGCLLEMAVNAGDLTERQSGHIRDESRKLLEAVGST